MLSIIQFGKWEKISVDSSTFANKVMELFEAKVLFDLKSNMIDVVVEETSMFMLYYN